jgi:hypothetical protein
MTAAREMIRLFTVREAAGYLRLSMSTLNRLRVSGGGPRYAKLAGKVLYDVTDLDGWIEDGKRGSTSDSRAA